MAVTKVASRVKAAFLHIISFPSPLNYSLCIIVADLHPLALNVLPIFASRMGSTPD